MKDHGASVMGVASIVARPLKSDVSKTMHSAPIISRVKQLFQTLRQGTRNMTAVQHWTRIF
jgi:hypothetical protein